MNKLPLVSTLIAFTFATQANAVEATPYFSIKAGSATMTSKIDNDKSHLDNGLINLALGTKINNMFRAEIAFDYQGGGEKETTIQNFYFPAYYNTKDTGSVKSVMLNGYYDIATGTKFTPYVGAGIGAAKVEYVKKEVAIIGYLYDYNKSSASKTKFTWNVNAGVSYALNAKMDLDLGYRYADYGSFTKDDVKFATKTSEVMLGIRCRF